MRVAAACALALLVAGCGRGAVTVGIDDDVDDQLRRARESGRPTYYAGRTIAGFRLGHIDGEEGVVTYGTCVIPRGFDGGCSPPVQIQEFRYRPADWRAAVGCARRPSVLGVRTVHHDGLVLFTGRRVVKIYAPSPLLVARALRRVADDARVTRLPPSPTAVLAVVDRVCR